MLLVVWLDISSLFVALALVMGAGVFGWVTVALFAKGDDRDT